MTVAVRELTKAGFATTWLAADDTYTDRHRKTRTLKTSVFPGYLFVEFDVTDERWRMIASRRGVRCILGSDPLRPTALPDGTLDQLRAKFRAGEFKLKPLPGVAKGDRVVFEAGPFAGFGGVVTQSKGERIRVLMDIFGAKREVKSVRSDMVRRAMA